MTTKALLEGRRHQFRIMRRRKKKTKEMWESLSCVRKMSKDCPYSPLFSCSKAYPALVTSSPPPPPRLPDISSDDLSTDVERKKERRKRDTIDPTGGSSPWWKCSCRLKQRKKEGWRLISTPILLLLLYRDPPKLALKDFWVLTLLSPRQEVQYGFSQAPPPPSSPSQSLPPAQMSPPTGTYSTA